MARWPAVLLILMPFGCSDGTVNNDDAVVATTIRVSLSSSGGEGNGPVLEGRISGDGTRVVFSSGSSNLHPDDPDVFHDVYVKTLATGELYLASRGDGMNGAKAFNKSSSGPRISRDGRRVVFATDAQLHPDDNDIHFDVYVRDIQSHETILASRASGLPGANKSGGCFDPDISPDGRYVVFRSMSTELSPDDGDAAVDAYLRDLESGVTELVSRVSGAGAAKVNGEVYEVRVSEGGGRVVFVAYAPNLGSTQQQVYVRDRASHQTLVASRADGVAGLVPNGPSFSAEISADGRQVAFVTFPDLDPLDADANSDVYLRDLDQGKTVFVSRADGAEGANSFEQVERPSVSADGRFVSFSTRSANLVPRDENGDEDVFVRDVVLSRTFRVSLKTFGGEIARRSAFASLSEDARAVLFFSEDSLVVDRDGNGEADFFVRTPLR